MMKIVLLSDNHGYTGDDIIPYIEECDEIWHAGDMGSLESIEFLKQYAPVIGVYGNIDDQDVRLEYPLDQHFERQGLKIFMTHIGGYPGRYTKRVYEIIRNTEPNLYICGHSHICKVVKDRENNLIHMNPGAYGQKGFHNIRTLLKFDLENQKINNLSAVELGYRGKIDYDRKS